MRKASTFIACLMLCGCAIMNMPEHVKQSRQNTEFNRLLKEAGSACQPDGKRLTRKQEEACAKEADAGNNAARYILAYSLMGAHDKIGDHKVQDYDDDMKRAVSLLIKASNDGLAYASFTIGRMYLDPRGLGGVRNDAGRGLRWLELAGDQGYPFAYTMIGQMMLEGKEVEQDERSAIRWFLRAAEKNEPEALASLGVVYLRGQVVEPDSSKALAYFEDAAERGSSLGMLMSGMIQAKHATRHEDYVSALRWFKLASLYGQTVAEPSRKVLEKKMSPEGIEEAEALVAHYKPEPSPLR